LFAFFRESNCHARTAQNKKTPSSLHPFDPCFRAVYHRFEPKFLVGRPLCQAAAPHTKAKMVNLGGLGGWRLLVHVFLPIPLVLTLLLVVPFPRNLRKGVLLFTHRTLSFTMIGAMRLVHFSLLASGIPLLGVRCCWGLLLFGVVFVGAGCCCCCFDCGCCFGR
jgi:hypothetical protein